MKLVPNERAAVEAAIEELCAAVRAEAIEECARVPEKMILAEEQHLRRDLLREVASDIRSLPAWEEKR